ncbi:MAG: YbjN domain-containing protein [Candidatus Bathyarchaeota archaeon]|nr:YbjN domain-containing protein [Candidatus Bathyarchaeota archaeon]
MVTLEELRSRIETYMRQKGLPYTVEPTGIYRISHGTTFVRLGVFQTKAGVNILKLMAPVALEITKITPELTRFLAEKNGELLFGKFSLYTKNKNIMYEHTLFGDTLSAETLYTSIVLIVGTADQFDEQVAKMAAGKRVKDLL